MIGIEPPERLHGHVERAGRTRREGSAPCQDVHQLQRRRGQPAGPIEAAHGAFGPIEAKNIFQPVDLRDALGDQALGAPSFRMMQEDLGLRTERAAGPPMDMPVGRGYCG